MSCIIENLEFYAGPSNLGADDNLEDVIVDFINGAEKRLGIAVQGLENEAIAKAIINAREKKIIVKIVIEHDYLRSKKIQNNPWVSNPNSKNENNRLVHDEILRSNIDIKTDYNSGIFHQKFIVRDRKSLLTDQRQL